MTGPIGKQRGVGKVILFSIITVGVYSVYWQYKSFQEMKEFSGEGIGGGLGLVLAIVAGIVNIFLLPQEVGKLYARSGQAQPVSGKTGCWIFLPLGTIVWCVKVQGALNTFWAAQSPVAAAPVNAMI